MKKTMLLLALTLFFSCQQNKTTNDASHEKLLKIGNMPPALMREALFQDV